MAAFSAVLAVSISALGFQLLGFRRMERTFVEMRDHEGQMRLALQLEDAVRDQYAHEARFAMGATSRLADYEDARARALELTRRLTARIDEPDAILWMEQAENASSELDRRFHDRIAPAARNRDPSAVMEHDRSYPLVALIEQNMDRLFERLQDVSSRFREDLVAAERSSLGWTALLLVATPLFVAAAVVYLSRSIAMPLARLSRGAAAIAGGDLETRIEIDTPDEFGALAAEFNAMTAALKQNQARLVESEKLAGIGRLAAGVAHELNNPLQVMLGYLSLNRDTLPGPLASQLAAVENETLRCKEIVEGLLELSRPPAKGVPVDLRTFCEDVAGRVQVAVQRRTPRMSVDGAASALADPQRLGQVLFNLMKNAAEAAGPEGDVTVGIAASGEAVEVAVRDSGPGVPSEVRGRLFEPFFTTKPTGTGLGLAVSRAIARAHGGDIEVGNGAAGGAIFTLRLPRAPEGRS